VKLYSSLGPNPRFVRMFILEKGLDIERVHIDILTAENRQPDFADKNIMGTTPVLQLDDGFMLSEIMAIAEYLEETQPEPPLIGTTALERAEVRMWTRRIDLEIAVPMTLGFRGGAGRPMFEPRMDVVGAEGAADLSRMSDNKWKWLDGQLEGKDYICQDKFTMADLMAYCFVQFGYTVGWSLPEGTENLAKFVDLIGERPSSKVWQDSE